MENFFLQLDDQTTLHCCAWLPEGEPRAVVQIIHGIAEYVARYDALAAFLADHGFQVVGEDHPGHGQSVGEGDQYGYMNGGWMNTVKGIHLLQEKTHTEWPQVPYFMLGHSMGSFLLRTYLFTYPTRLQGVMISGTAWQPSLLLHTGLLLCAAEGRRLGERNSSVLLQKMMFDAYNRKFAPNRTSYDWVSSDPQVVDAYAKDPYCTFQPTIQLCREMLRGLRMIQQTPNLKKMDHALPVYFFAGAQDPVGNMGKGVKHTFDMFRQVGMDHAELKLYPGMRHETHNEIGREVVFSDLLYWLEKHVYQVIGCNL